MHEIDKFRRKLREEELAQIDETVRRIHESDLRDMDIKKLKGKNNTFRVRVGKYRIKFVKTEKHGFVVVEISRRDESTYK